MSIAIIFRPTVENIFDFPVSTTRGLRNYCRKLGSVVFRFRRRRHLVNGKDACGWRLCARHHDLEHQQPPKRSRQKKLFVFCCSIFGSSRFTPHSFLSMRLVSGKIEKLSTPWNFFASSCYFDT